MRGVVVEDGILERARLLLLAMAVVVRATALGTKSPFFWVRFDRRMGVNVAWSVGAEGVAAVSVMPAAAPVNRRTEAGVGEWSKVNMRSDSILCNPQNKSHLVSPFPCNHGSAEQTVSRLSRGRRKTYPLSSFNAFGPLTHSGEVRNQGRSSRFAFTRGFNRQP